MSANPTFYSWSSFVDDIAVSMALSAPIPPQSLETTPVSRKVSKRLGAKIIWEAPIKTLATPTFAKTDGKGVELFSPTDSNSSDMPLWMHEDTLTSPTLLSSLRRTVIGNRRLNYVDDGSEATLEAWVTRPLQRIVGFCLSMAIQELTKEDRLNLTPAQYERFCMYCRGLELVTKRPDCNTTVADFFVPRMVHYKLKAWSFTPLISDIIGRLRKEEGITLHSELWQMVEEGRTVGTTAQASVCQVAGSLDQEKTAEGILFRVFGALYWAQWDNDKWQLLITDNLDTKSQSALRDGEARKNPENYRSLIQILMQYSYRQVQAHLLEKQRQRKHALSSAHGAPASQFLVR
ncbi:hypothetical protein MD484_g7544, partial [Candolleomyces efflorescens]